jgi:hypothetical protein
VGIDDSGAGVCAIRLSGFSTIGVSGGNIIDSGAKALCNLYCEQLSDILAIIQ